jgi:hypothetical protein
MACAGSKIFFLIEWKNLHLSFNFSVTDFENFEIAAIALHISNIRIVIVRIASTN